jgi:hypothetical protein
MGSAISYFKNLRKNLTDKTTYKIVMFMLAGYVLSTLLGGYISDNYIGMEGIVGYVINAVLVCILLYASNFLILYFMIAKPCKMKPALLIPACLLPTAPGAIGLLRIMVRAGPIGIAMYSLASTSWIRAVIGCFPCFMWSVLSVVAIKCKTA